MWLGVGGCGEEVISVLTDWERRGRVWERGLFGYFEVGEGRGRVWKRLGKEGEVISRVDM